MKNIRETIRHTTLETTVVNNIVYKEISKLDKKNIFVNTTDTGFHSYTPYWWTNTDCPVAYKYLHLDSLYPPFYFQPGGGHPNEYVANDIYQYMQYVYKNTFNKQFSSVLELGCGGGEITTQFAKNNLDYIAVEGTDAGVRQLINVGIDPTKIIKSDLRLFKGIDRKFDVVMCTEVAEHLEPSFASKIVELCVSHADAVWFSAAEPLVNGPHYHHPNELYIECWDNLFAFFGFNKFAELNNMHSRGQRLYLKT